MTVALIGEHGSIIVMDEQDLVIVFPSPRLTLSEFQVPRFESSSETILILYSVLFLHIHFSSEWQFLIYLFANWITFVFIVIFI